MVDKMWFGHARGHLQYVPCPLIGSSVTRNRYVESIRFENGGGDGRRSNQYQMQYDFQFSGLAHKVDGIDAFNKFAQGFYGDDLIYLAHPAAFETNLFPAGWATPSLSEKGWGKISTDAVSYSDADGPSVTNLVTNPSMEGVASGTDSTIRTNLVTNPNAGTDLSNWSYTAGTLTRQTGSSVFNFGTYFRSVPTAAGQFTYIDFPTTIGSTYTVSLYMKNPSALARLDFRSGSGTIITAGTNATNSDWTRIKVSGVATESISRLLVRNEGIGTIDFVGAMAEATSDMRSYFDGTYAEDPTLIEAWTGTVNNSTSTALVRGVSNRENLITNPSFEVDTTGWGVAGSGTRTFSRVTTQQYSGTASAEVVCAGDVAAQGLLTTTRPSVTAGATYTASGWVKAVAGQIIRIELGGISSSGALIGSRYSGGNITATGAWQRLTVSGVMPTGSVTADIIFRNVNAVAHTFYVDAVMLEQSTTVNPYFDGSYTDTPGWTTSWAGTANASRSVATAAPVTVRTNLVTNPSMETVTAGSVVMRRNLVKNPNFETDALNWSAYGVTNTRVTSEFFAGTASLRIVSDGSTSGAFGYTTPVTDTGLQAGSKFSSSIRVKATAGTLLRAVLGSDGTGGIDVTDNTLVATGSWQLVKLEGATLGANRNPYVAVGNRNGSAAAVTVYVDSVIIEMGATVGDYFDGSTTDALGWDYAWSGTANASISTAACAATTVRTNLVTNPSFEADLTSWSAGSATFTRVTTQAYFGTASGSAVFAAQADNGPTVTVTTTASTTYTGSAWVKAEAGKLFRMRILEYNGATYVGEASTGDVTGTGVWQRVSVSRAFGSTGTVGKLAFENRTVGAHTLYIDAVQLEAGSVASDYFDGSFNPAGDFSYAWTGTANASTSIQRGATVAGTGNGHQSRAEKYVGSASIARITQAYNENVFLGDTTVTASQTYTASAWVKGESGKKLLLEFGEVTSGGTVVDNAYSAEITCDGTWQRISAVNAFGSTGVKGRIVIYNRTAGAHTFYVDAAMLEASPIVQDYFDGSVVSADADLTNSWSGTPHASTSLMRGVGVASSTQGGGTASIQSTGWSSTGTKSIRIIPTTTANNSWVQFNIPTTVGATYTVMGKLRQTQALAGNQWPNARRINAYNSGLSTIVGQSAQAANAAGVYSHSVTFVAASTTTAILLGNGASAGNGEVWWDDLLVVQGTYTGDYFDGNSTDSGNTTYNWTGTANASTSTMLSEMVLYGNPPRATTYTVTNINQPPTKVCTLVIPPEYTLYLGASGTSTGSAGVFIRPIQASDSLYYGPTEELTLLDPNGSVRMNKTLNGATYQAIEVFLMKTDANVGTVTLNSMMAQLYKTGTTPQLPSEHYQGEGSTGLMFADDAIVETYSYMHPPRKGISTKLIEVEAWR